MTGLAVSVLAAVVVAVAVCYALVLTLVRFRRRRQPPPVPARPRYPGRSIVVDGVTHPSASLMALIESEKADGT